MHASFFDTNILVYARDAGYPRKQERAAELVRGAFEAGTGRISYQVIHEFYVTVTQKLKPGLPKLEARAAVLALADWEPVTADEAMLRHAWVLQDRHQLSFWDALIVAAALACRCSLLYSEDLQHGKKYEGLRVVNPFVAGS